MPDRIALRVIQFGALAVVLAVASLHVFELDRFFVPKELVLHVTALIVGVVALRASGHRVDWFLASYLFLSALSAVFATNPWLAMRAVAISASGIVLFWVARRLREAGLAQALLSGIALAVVAAAATSLLQTYGVDVDFFSRNRAPGGTLGNRNFVAHIAAFGTPVLLLTTLRSRLYVLWAVASAGVIASLVLTRSRAAWLAFAVVMIVFLFAMVWRGDRRAWLRLGGIVVLAAGALAAVIVLPNALRWRSDNPYLETMQRVTDYESGSGRGRLVQYERSLLMAARNPILGVGPGNWPVRYPSYAARNDPSLNDSDPGMTTNPWPSSDWVATVAERGFVATALLGIVFVIIAFSGLRQLRNAVNADEGLIAAALLATIAGALVTGLFDAVLLLAVPAFLVWTAIGALWVPDSSRSISRFIVILAILVVLLGVVRSASQWIGMQIYATHSDRASLVRAARIDPGNYRLRLRLARGGKGRCEHALAAHALFPNAQAARAATRGCGE